MTSASITLPCEMVVAVDDVSAAVTVAVLGGIGALLVPAVWLWAKASGDAGSNRYLELESGLLTAHGRQGMTRREMLRCALFPLEELLGGAIGVAMALVLPHPMWSGVWMGWLVVSRCGMGFAVWRGTGRKWESLLHVAGLGSLSTMAFSVVSNELRHPQTYFHAWHITFHTFPSTVVSLGYLLSTPSTSPFHIVVLAWGSITWFLNWVDADTPLVAKYGGRGLLALLRFVEIVYMTLTFAAFASYHPLCLVLWGTWHGAIVLLVRRYYPRGGWAFFLPAESINPTALPWYVFTSFIALFSLTFRYYDHPRPSMVCVTSVVLGVSVVHLVLVCMGTPPDIRDKGGIPSLGTLQRLWETGMHRALTDMLEYGYGVHAHELWVEAVKREDVADELLNLALPLVDINARRYDLMARPCKECWVEWVRRLKAACRRHFIKLDLSDAERGHPRLLRLVLASRASEYDKVLMVRELADITGLTWYWGLATDHPELSTTLRNLQPESRMWHPAPPTAVFS